MKLLTLILIAIVIGLQYRIWVGEGSLAEVWRLKHEIMQQRELNAQTQERNDQLLAEVLDLKDGLEALEERARRELGMIHRDEVFFQIVDE